MRCDRRGHGKRGSQAPRPQKDCSGGKKTDERVVSPEATYPKKKEIEKISIQARVRPPC